MSRCARWPALGATADDGGRASTGERAGLTDGGSSRSARFQPRIRGLGSQDPTFAPMTQTPPAAPRSPRSAASSPRSPARARSSGWPARRPHVADGVGTTLPVFVVAAGGGVLVDVDGNSLIDLGSGIAVVTRRQRRARGRPQRCTSRSRAFTHTCFMVTPYDGYVDVCEALAELTPGDHAKKSALFNSGAEAVENAVKIARVATGRDAVVVFDHAYHGRTNLTMAMTAKNMPYKHGFGPFAGEVYRAPMSYPFRDGLSGEEAAARAIDAAREAGRRRQPRLRRDRADPGRGRLRRARAAASCPPWPRGRRTTASCSSPTRSRPASAAPATGSPATTRASCPT